jgi:hypothetical protein
MIMQIFCRNQLTIVSFIALLLTVCFLVIPVSAGLKVTGSKYMDDVILGDTTVHVMTVSSRPEDPRMEIIVEVSGFGQASDMGYTTLLPGQDTGAFTARPYITLDADSIVLNPGESKDIKATLHIPQDAGSGGRYALIYLHTKPVATGQMGIVSAITVPVMITLKDTPLTETGRIDTVNVSRIETNKPAIVSTTFTHTGNHHFYGAVNEIFIKDSSGATIATITTDPEVHALIPGQTVVLRTPLGTTLVPGTYTVTSRILNEGILLDEVSDTFTVNEEYIPPFEEVSVNVISDKETVLMTSGGEIAITFPAGAVLSDAEVSVSPYSQDLPVLPEGVKAGITAFTIDGLTGLLAKPATLIVQYNPADVQAANGDASKLSLARYDRTDSRWTLVPTSVDTNTMTLTATTDRFSTWAVMAIDDGGMAVPKNKSAFSLGPDPLLICGFIALVLLVKGLQKRV